MDQTLVLNATYEPLRVVPWQKAITLLFQGKVEVIAVYDREIRGVTVRVRLPSVLRLLRRVRMKRSFAEVPFSRANVYARDDHACQYCGERFPPSQLTFDHVVPVARGGAQGLGQHRHLLHSLQPPQGRPPAGAGGAAPRPAPPPPALAAPPHPEPRRPPHARQLARLPLLGPHLGRELTLSAGRRSMSLRGDLRTMALPDVLQWIASGRKTGTLHVERRSVQKRIILRDGNIFSSWSNDPRESLGQFLIRLRLVTEEQLFRALLGQEEKGRLLGSILVADGVLGEDDLRRALKAKAEETVYDLFLWPSGQFEFREGEFPEIHITFESQVTPVILEGIRRVDEWQRIRAVFPNLETTFKVSGPPPAGADPVEKQVLALAAAGKNLAEMSLELRRSEFETAALVFDLHARGLLTVGQVRAGNPAADPVGAIQALLALAYQRLQEKRYEAALKAYEDVLALDRLNQNAKKGLIAAMEARQRERQVHTVPRDKVPSLAVDFATLTKQNLDPHEGFVLSRVNGQWDVQSILKLCPMGEEEAMLIFARLFERKLIKLE